MCSCVCVRTCVICDQTLSHAKEIMIFTFKQRKKMHLKITNPPSTLVSELVLVNKCLKPWLRPRILRLCVCCQTTLHPALTVPCSPHRCYFSRPTVIPKCFSAECFSKQSSVVKALFTRALCPAEVQKSRL